MDYVRFGSGEKALIILPGLGDGLRSVKGTALLMALTYRTFAKHRTVYMFSRKAPLPPDASTRSMARDLKEAVAALNIPRADILGVSMGGMIAQHFAADFPQLVDRLILVATCASATPELAACVDEWVALAKMGDHAALMDSNLRRIYSSAYYRRNKWLVPFAGALTKPRSYRCFLQQAAACLSHNAEDQLSRICAETLVIGGEKDLVTGANASHLLAAAIPSAQLHMYERWGHGLYDEARDFTDVVLQFLLK